MGVIRLAPAAAAVETLEVLGVNGDAGLSSTEALAAAVRRTASFACPATRGALVRTTSDALAGLPGSTEDTRDRIAEIVDALLGYGDLLELPSEGLDGRSSRQLFLGPPGYVRRESGRGFLVVGIRPEGAPIVSADLSDAIEYVQHARLLSPAPDKDLVSQLAEQDLIQFTAEQWLGTPRPSAPRDFVAAYRAALDAHGMSGAVELQLLDLDADVRYYRGRWRGSRQGDTGEFVARRSQGFGADLWCFVRLLNGEVKKLIDLPIEAALSPAHDEAWRLQAALDTCAGHPQVLNVESVGTEKASLHIFSPVPSWAQRRLGVIGTAVPRRRGALFTFDIPAHEVQEEIDFLREMMWLTVERV